MDARATFLDGLVLPRAVLPIRGGALVIAPPDLLFARDVDGDGRADEREVLATGLGGIESPEHAANGLALGVDGWILLANHPYRYRWSHRPNQGLTWERQPVAQAGQWGIARDDLGRAFFNTNPDPLRGDPYSSHYAVRNAALGRADGVNVGYAPDKRTWPGRVTPGVNRGYRAGVLRADLTLASFTAACAPLVYRGDRCPDLRGDAFVCEPAGNLVKRFRLEERDDGAFVAHNVAAGVELWTSTDERFRPVHLFDGPDGALYCVDLYRGIVQHRLFVTTYLRRQIRERGLDAPVGLGRIWRVVPAEDHTASAPDLAGATWSELGMLLGHPNGWVRDRAQWILATEGANDRAALTAARAALVADEPLARMHALWALSIARRLEPERVLTALADPDPRVVHAAVRCAEPLLGVSDPVEHALVAALERAAAAGDGVLARQVVLSLGEGRAPEPDDALLRVLAPRVDDALLRSAAVSGLGGRELDAVLRVAARPEWVGDAPGRAELVATLAACVARRGMEEDVERLLLLATTRPPAAEWQAAALLRGVLAARPNGPDGAPTYLPLAVEPAAFERLAALRGDTAGPLGRAVADALAWPGKTGVDRPQVRPLTAAERERFERGRALFAATCAPCHQASGLGEGGKAPPLRWSPTVLGDAGRLARIVRFGLVGEIEVGGEVWNGEMPAWPASDADLACVLTYARRAWGHGAEPVTPNRVAAAIAEAGDRARPYTAEEVRE
jgi:putative membrane-bound dehydrogenase-like protein